ncbi:MAG: hypothetical protein OEY66_07060 [Gammaproteobacteria bacterium]|nr:hypothetical protein [Gammaproteobacteria bacterium]
MTASNCRVSQVSQGFEWYRADLYSVETVEGYRVMVQKVGGRWVYSAFSPCEKIIRNGDRWFFRGFEYKDRYEIGEQVPPAFDFRGMTASMPLGCFRDVDFGGTEPAMAAAKDACWLDWLNNNNGVCDGED